MVNRRGLLALVTFVGLACSGSNAEDPGRGGMPTMPGAAGSGGSAQPVTPAGGVGGSPTPMMPASCGVAETPLRRLTRFEYNNTIRDLVGDTTNAGNALPPDSALDGFDNNALAQSTQPLHAAAFMQVAEELTAKAKLDSIVPCPIATADQACARRFISDFGKRAFRRPLTAAEGDELFALYRTHASAGPDLALRMVTQALLSAPQFMYRIELAGGRLTPYDVASRLSYFILGSMPDTDLFGAADRNELSTPQQVAAQARRLLDTPKARARMRDFFQQWTAIDDVVDVMRDPMLYTGWKDVYATFMRHELWWFTERVMFDLDGSYRSLMTAPFTYANRELFGHYENIRANNTTFDKLDRDPTKYSGLLTMGGFMALNAKAEQSSPIYRGRWVREQILCQHLPQPPAEVMAATPPVDASSTTRQRHEQHQKDPVCSACHRLIDPVGFLFENYDAVGRWRTMDGRIPVDSAGELVDAGDLNGRYRNAAELGRKLGDSETGRDCQVRMMFRYAHGRAETPADRCTLDAIRTAFAMSGGNLKQLVVQIAQSEVFLNRGGN